MYINHNMDLLLVPGQLCSGTSCISSAGKLIDRADDRTNDFSLLTHQLIVTKKSNKRKMISSDEHRNGIDNYFVNHSQAKKDRCKCSALAMNLQKKDVITVIMD